jgi:hypothetical protein
VKDLVVIVTLVLAFALFITAHVAIVYGLARRTPRWHAAVALFVAPLGGYWAWRGQMRIRAGIWSAALVLYVIATIVARA